MPLFIFLSGYFSKKIENQRIKDVKDLLVPYLVIQILYFVILSFASPQYKWSLVLPIGANWYLLGLFVWRMLAPYFLQTSNALLYSVIIGLFVGLIPDINQILNLQRIFTYLPFFVMGYMFVGNYKEKLLISGRLIWIVFLFLFTFSIVSSYYFPEIIKFFKNSQVTLYPFTGNMSEKVSQILGRLGFYFIAIIISFLFMQLIPNKKTIYSSLGKKSLYVFLFHMFFIYIIAAVLPYKNILTELLAIPISVILTFILSTNIVVTVLEKLIYPWKSIFNVKLCFNKFINKQ